MKCEPREGKQKRDGEFFRDHKTRVEKENVDMDKSILYRI